MGGGTQLHALLKMGFSKEYLSGFVPSSTPFRHPRFFAPVMYVNLLPCSCPFCPRVQRGNLRGEIAVAGHGKKGEVYLNRFTLSFSNLFLSLAPEENSSRFVNYAGITIVINNRSNGQQSAGSYRFVFVDDEITRRSQASFIDDTHTHTCG